MSADQQDRIVAAILTAGVVASWRESLVATEDGAMVSVGPEPVQATEAGVRRVLWFYRGMLALMRRAHIADRAGANGDDPAA